MIKTIRIQNFRSIRDATLDLSYAERKAPNGYREAERLPFLEEKGGAFRGVPVLALYGANAAGKTNLLMAVNALRRAALGIAPGRYPFFQPDKLRPAERKTEMAIEFLADGTSFVYRLTMDGGGFLHEELEADGKTLFSVSPGKTDLTPLACTAYPKDRLERIIEVECSNPPTGRMVRSLLGVLGRNYAELNANVAAAFRFFDRGMMPSATEDLSMPVFPRDVRALAELRGIGEEAVLDEIADIVRQLDVDIRGLRIVRSKTPTLDPAATPAYQQWAHVRDETGESGFFHLETTHMGEDGNAVPFRLADEDSSGTERLVFLVARFLLALERGAAVFVDELESSLHPLLVRSMLNLFIERRRNVRNAVLVFSTHCTDLMDDSILRLSEIGIVSTAPKTGSIVRRLSDLRAAGADIRNVTDFRKQYLNGFYSGVPYPML